MPDGKIEATSGCAIQACHARSDEGVRLDAKHTQLHCMEKIHCGKQDHGNRKPTSKCTSGWDGCLKRCGARTAHVHLADLQASVSQRVCPEFHRCDHVSAAAGTEPELPRPDPLTGTLHHEIYRHVARHVISDEPSEAFKEPEGELRWPIAAKVNPARKTGSSRILMVQPLLDFTSCKRHFLGPELSKLPLGSAAPDGLRGTLGSGLRRF